MNELNGAALVSHLQKQGKEFTKRKHREKLRKEFERMQLIVQEHERLTALDLRTYRLKAYASIARSTVAIVFYTAPCIVLGAVTVKAILWLLF